MKWVELLKAIIPDLASIMILWNPDTPSTLQTQAVSEAAQRFGVKVDAMEIRRRLI